MRWFRNWNVVMLAVAFLAVFALAAQAEIPAWVQWLPANSPALSILYRAFPTPAGPTSVRLPPRVTAPPLVLLAARNPLDAELVAFSAQEFEAQLDFMQAEARWKLLEAVSADRAASRIALADYYHRRMQPQQELQALASADARLPAVEDQLQPDNQQRAWKLHERVQQLIQAETVPAAAAIQDYEAWIAKYPQADSLYRRYFDFVLAAGMPARASQILERHQRTFPNDRVFPVHARTALAEKRGFPGGAIAVYDAAFDPLWPQELLDGYFKLLTDSHKLYDFYQNARRRALAAPLEAAPVGRLFHYYKKQEDLSAARRELSEFRVRKEAARASWTAPELSTLAKLNESADDYEEVIRYSYALYSLPGADDASVERALVQIITTLLKAPDRPIRFGLGNLSFYRDIATIDSSPGFLNGILSLIFNSQDPDTQFKSQEAKSQAYFHRAKAAEIYALLSDRFPMSARRSELLSRLIESYALYGENEAIIRQGTIFINAFPDAAQRTKVALQIADAHARQKQVPEELAVYDRLLRELAAKAQQVPLGGGAPRSGDYALVLQRNISRLRQLNRIPDALALYRREIDRNPNDPGLYDSLADFLGANQRASEVEQVYRQAMQRFQDRSWWHKLARFYLRNRQAGQFQALSREVVDAFSGADVEKYIADVAADAALERRLQLEINLYAQTRFPHDLRFVHNLIPLYSGGPTADSAALVRLLGQHWYEDEMIRRMYFERLAAGGSLRQVVQDAVNLLPEDSRNRWPQAEAANPAVTRFIAEAEAWQSHFESAAPVMRAVAAAYPADSLFAGRAVDLLRSLAAYDPGNTAVAASIADNLSRSEPRNRERLTRIGEIYADREMMGPATAVWARHPLIEPGKPDGYLEAATLSWDYLRPSDAMNWLRQGRTRLKDSALWTYEMGAILEAQGRRSDAVAEYLKGALAGRSNSRARLLQLATRVDYKTLVDTQTKRRVETSPADAQVLQLRVSVLRQQKRSSELEPMLGAITDGTSSREILSYIREVADESGLGLIRERVLRREAVVESDPQEQLRLRLELVELLEARGDLDQARREMESIYQSNSLISGVIRATADYYWRHDKPRSIQVLRSAAERAHASLKKDYLTETVRKSIEAKLYPDAIQSAEALLRIDPIDGSFIATMGDALAAGGRDAELRQLYVSKISEIQQSQISQSDKTDRIALMRRGLIPVFVRQGEFREALDQFIEIINRFPNDENVLAEAGRLAAQHGLQSRLVDYYAKTVAEAPRDPRWSIILARIHTQFENYPAAIEAYTKAMAARPERQDLAIARAELEERTFRFADAIATYNRVYELSHGKPVWLERTAVLQARLGQNQDVIATLQRAYIDNRPEASREYGRVARVLEERGMIAPAADFMQRQIARGTQSGWERDYARIMTRARRYDEAFQVSLDGFNTRRVMGEAVALYFTPAEKQTFVSFLTERRRNARPEQLRNFTDIANAAHLYDLEVAWRLEEFARLSQQRDSEQEYGSLQALQQRRMRFAELATQLEDLASKVQPNERPGVLISAMRAYREIGDSASELRLITAHSELQVADRQRYYELLSAARPEELLDLASRTDSAGLLAVQVLIAAGDRTRALEAVRTQKREPVWNGAYTGLVGLYFGSNSPEIRAAFQSVLGSPVIQDRVGKPVDRANQLAGDIWFYYGQRYAEYLRDLGESQAAADYWLSQVEARPADPEAYVELGRYFRDIAEPERAVAEFRHALELDAKRADIHSSIALILWDTGKRNDALAEWRNGLTKFEKAPNSPAGPRIIRDIRSRQQDDALRMEIDSALRTAARTQPIWQLPPLLEAAFENSMDDAWLLDVVGGSQTPGPLLSSLADQAWLSERQQKLVLQAAVRALSSAPGRSRFEYQQMRQKYMRFLLDHQDAPAARQLLDSFSDAEKRSAELRQTEIRIAAMEGMLEMLLQHYKLAPSEAPPDWTLQEAAAALDRAGSVNESRQVLEFLYSRQIEGFATNPTAFLGLAEIRVKQGRVNEAVDLLKRLNLISPVPFENLMASARVLSSGGRGAEAADFLKLRLQAVPWDDEARLELARVQLALNQAQGVIESLQQVAASARAAYDVRAQAAREQARSGSPQAGSSGSREMDLLSGRIQLTPETAGGPYFFLTRMVAAEQSADPSVRVRLLLGAVAERPEDSAVRRLLFRAALDSKQYRLALAVFRRGDSADSEINTSMGEAYLQLGQPRDAARSFALAASQERNAARKQALSERQKQALAANERLLEDERRRPVIRAGVDQPNPVKRRLP